MNIYDLPHKLDYIELEDFHLASFLLIILIFTSLFEIDAWNFLYINLMSKLLAFSTIHFKYMLFSLFLSQILICATTFLAHYLFLRFDIDWVFKQKKKRVGRDIRTSLRMSQDQQNYWLIIHDKFEDLFTTITWISRWFPQIYKCIENKLSSLMHKAISTEVQG